jgi:hypothetical protein
MTEMNTVIAWGIEIQRALIDSGAIGPIMAPIRDQVMYEPPAKKNATIRIGKLLKTRRRTSDTLHNESEAANAYDFFHLSPNLPRTIPKTADPKNKIEPKTPISKSP